MLDCAAPLCFFSNDWDLSASSRPTRAFLGLATRSEKRMFRLAAGCNLSYLRQRNPWNPVVWVNPAQPPSWTAPALASHVTSCRLLFVVPLLVPLAPWSAGGGDRRGVALSYVCVRRLKVCGSPAGCVSCELVCVCVSLVRVVIICPASTHTALVSSPSLTVLHLPTYLPSGGGTQPCSAFCGAAYPSGSTYA